MALQKIGHDLATEQQQLDKVFPENYVLRDSHNWEIPSLRSLWCPCNVPVQLPPGHSSSEELTTLWNRLFRLENLPEVLSGTQCLLASSLWSWSCHTGFPSGSHSHGWGPCSSPQVSQQWHIQTNVSRTITPPWGAELHPLGDLPDMVPSLALLSSLRLSPLRFTPPQALAPAISL